MSWPPPLRYVIPLALLVVAGTSGVVSQFYGLALDKKALEETFVEHAQTLGTKVGTMSAYFLENGSPVGAQREVALTVTEPGLKTCLVLDGANRVLFSTRHELDGHAASETPAASHVALITEARAKHAGSVEFSSQRDVLWGAFPFQIPERKSEAGSVPQAGMVFLEFDLAKHKALDFARAQRRFAVGGFVLLGFVGVFSLFAGRLLMSRVHRLTEAARRLATGDHGARSGLRGADELAQISRAFDQMASDLDRRDAELRESEERFRFLADSIPQVFWLDQLDPPRTIYVAPAFARVWGRPIEDLPADGPAWSESIYDEDRPRVLDSFQKWLARQGATYDETYRIVRPSGEVRWVRNRATRVEPDAGGFGRIAGIAEDITEQRRLEEEKADFDGKVRETQKLESLGVLAGGIAHDFNNLLTGILGNASLARQDIPSTSPGQAYLEQIEAVAMRAADLCKQMLAYSGKGRFQVQRLDLSELIRDTAALVQLSISKSVVLRFDLTDSLPAIEADPTQVRQIIMNLVINASEAIGGKSGVICLNTGVVRVDQEYLSRTVLSPDLPADDYVFMEIGDNGCGMTPEVQARVFEPFFTTKFTGRGLGLSAVLGIVRGHKGAMKVYSEAGKGTSFKLLFPIAPGPVQPLQSQEPVESWSGSGSILIVDDDQTIRAVTARMVEKFGLTPIIAVDGREGVDRFLDRRSEIRVVLMDLTMPHLDGEGAFREMRNIDPTVRVVLMSGFNEQDAVNRFTGKGLAGFLQKPFKAEALRRKLKEVLGGG